MPRVILALAVAGGVCCAPVPMVRAQSVWSGYNFSFSKPDFTDPTLPENQDRITDNVWITRGASQGIFNAKVENTFDGETFTSPADTEWATDLNNPGDTIAAANWAALSFDPWIDAYGGPASTELPARLIDRNAVVHLISDDIYLDLRFTFWRQGGGGAFAYERAEAPPGPDTTGDYNLDGFVNAADYVVWRKTFGHEVPEGTGADGVPDGTIDDADYNYWVEHFGETVTLGGGPTSTVVPEPAALPLTALILFMRVGYRYRQDERLR